MAGTFIYFSAGKRKRCFWRSCRRLISRAFGLLPIFWFCILSAAAQEDLEYFERNVRPVLIEHCFECHSESKQQGGLRLDHKSALREGGDSGPALIPGDPEASLLVKAISYQDPDLQMPPKGRLSRDKIEALVEWVRRGAPDPREKGSVPVKAGIDLEKGRQFWAYQPPTKTNPPEVKAPEWGGNAIDRFIYARLEENGIRPLPTADRRTLIRRVNYSLAGLPPTPAEVEAFLADDSDDAFEKLVDRLLASPQFGERWGRHWLDVARFGESVTLRGLIFKEAWRYRDYVIDAFNRDLPFDQFIREQVAGDLLPSESLEERRRRMIATTFLALGNTNLEEQDKLQLRMDVVDEQLDTIGKAFLGQTFGCARCHDHKFDPIPISDYYAMAGILRNAQTLIDANVSNWIELPLPLEPEEEAVHQEHEQALAALREQLESRREELKELTAALQEAASGPDVIAASELPGFVVDVTEALAVGEWKLSQYTGRFIGSGYLHDDNSGKGQKTLTFQASSLPAGRYEVRLAYSHAGSRATRAPVTILSAEGETMVHVNQRKAPDIEARFVSLGQFGFEANGQGFVLVSNEGTSGHVTADAVQFLPVELIGTQVAAGIESGLANTGQREKLDRAKEVVKQLESELKSLQASGPVRPKVMSVREEENIADTYVHIRGSVHNRGVEVPRGFMQVAMAGNPASLPENESGRRELADWLASPLNPLTARVFVNRVWHWLFGAGLAPTVDNFGSTGERPSHPELLDYLAVEFMEQGWPMKQLVRQIMLTRVYQSSSRPPSGSDGIELARAGETADPENRLLWRMNRRALEAEAIRDTMLWVSGELEMKMGGPTIPAGLSSDYGYLDTGTRRSVYVPVLRNALPELFELFGFADPSMVTGSRSQSTVAPQALFLMNHPFVAEQARHTARRLLNETAGCEDERVGRAYRLLLGREPSHGELQIAKEFGADTENDGEKMERWTALAQALFGSIDFRYLE
jgi:hypothetical protein